MYLTGAQVFPQITDISLTDADRSKQLDLSPYMNTAAISVHHSSHVAKVKSLFRALGLRHLTVVDTSNQVVSAMFRLKIELTIGIVWV